MSKKVIQIEKDIEDYNFYEGIKKSRLLCSLCHEEFDKVVKVIGLSKKETFNIVTIDSIRFIGMKEIVNNKEVRKFYLTYDGHNYYDLFLSNPIDSWDEKGTSYLHSDDIWYWSKEKFETMTGMSNKERIVFGFNSVEIRVR